MQARLAKGYQIETHLYEVWICDIESSINFNDQMLRLWGASVSSDVLKSDGWVRVSNYDSSDPSNFAFGIVGTD